MIVWNVDRNDVVIVGTRVVVVLNVVVVGIVVVCDRGMCIIVVYDRVVDVVGAGIVGVSIINLRE